MNDEVKVPEGVTIEKPKKNNSGPDIRKGYPVDPTLPQIVFPHYTNNAQDTLACVLIRPDGSTHKEENIPKDEKHPLYRDIVSQYSSWEIKTNTERQVHNQTAAQEAESDQKKEFENHKQREDLWNAKQDFLKLPCMKNPVCKEFKREVRKSQTVIGAQAFAVAAILKDFEDGTTK